MSKSSGTQKTTTSPWKPQQPYLKEGFQGAQDLYHQGPMSYYPGQTYADFNPIQGDAFGAAVNRSGGSAPEAGLNNYLTSMLGGSGIPDMGGTLDTLNRYQNMNPSGALDQSMRPIGLAGASRFSGNMSGTNPFAMNALNSSANGDMLNSNPYLDSMFGSASDAVTRQFKDSVMPGINATFASGGRTGSDLQAESISNASKDLGGTLNNLASNIYGGNYANERGMQMNAANSLNADDLARKGLSANMYNAGMDRSTQAGLGVGALGINAAGQYGDLYKTGLNGATAAASLVPSASSLDWNNINNLMGVGNAQQGQTQKGITENVDRYNFNQQAPYDNLSRYMQAINGQYGGTTKTSAGSGSPLSGALGGGMLGSALGGGLGSLFAGSGAMASLFGEGGAAGIGAAMGPWGMGLGALAGLLG